MKIALLLMMFCVVWGSAHGAGDGELLLSYESLKSFRAEFKQVFFNTVTKKKLDPEVGVIQYKSPSFMRFDYQKEGKTIKQIFVNTEGVSIVDHEKKTVSRKKGQNEASDYLVFLKGVAEIKKRFAVKKADAALARKAGIEVAEGCDIFKLTPLAKIPRLRYLFLIMKGKEVVSVAVVDEIGNINQYFFTAVQYDPKMDAALFTSPVPVGYEVSDL